MCWLDEFEIWGLCNMSPHFFSSVSALSTSSKIRYSKSNFKCSIRRLIGSRGSKSKQTMFFQFCKWILKIAGSLQAYNVWTSASPSLEISQFDASQWHNISQNLLRAIRFYWILKQKLAVLQRNWAQNRIADAVDSVRVREITLPLVYP